MIAINKNLDKSRISIDNDDSYRDKIVPIYKINKISQNLDIT